MTGDRGSEGGARRGVGEVFSRSRYQGIVGRTLFEYADEMAMAVPASCRRSGKCRECIVEIRSGTESLSAPTAAERFLNHGYRLACQAIVERADETIEFLPLRRKLRILKPEAASPSEIDPMVSIQHGRAMYEGDDLGPVQDGPFGVAVDVGTTTVVVDLVDLRTGVSAQMGAFENPQRFGGSDVMTRISYDASHPNELRHALRQALNHELRQMYLDLDIKRSSVCEVMVVGNSTMRDLFFALDVSPLGRSPYRSTTELDVRSGKRRSTWIVRLARELGVLVHPRARVVGAPLVASHVGGDATADLALIEDLAPDGTWMAIDIGTNTEVLLRHGERLLAASCPAGPAFEGGLVRYAMPAVEGAIEAVRTRDGNFEFDTIGRATPVGLCGSGLIDLLALLRTSGRMDSYGAFANGVREVTLGIGGITLSREDVSHLAQAKAANLVGQRILLERLGLSAPELDAVYVAGAFANAIDINHAVDIGLLIPMSPDRVIKLGNGASRGAKLLLLSKPRRARIDALIRSAEHIELEQHAAFFDFFVEGCQFDKTVET